MAAQPRFGGVNVTEMDVGQPGSTRNGAGQLHYAANVTMGPEKVPETTHEFPQQAFTVLDNLGWAGQIVTWSGDLRCDTLARYRTVRSELSEYWTGQSINATTGVRSAVDLAKMEPDKLVGSDGTVLTPRAKLINVQFGRGFAPASPSSWAWIIPLTLTFRMLE